MGARELCSRLWTAKEAMKAPMDRPQILTPSAAAASPALPTHHRSAPSATKKAKAAFQGMSSESLLRLLDALLLQKRRGRKQGAAPQCAAEADADEHVHAVLPGSKRRRS